MLFRIPGPLLSQLPFMRAKLFSVHAKTLAYYYAQYCCPMEGQSDVVVYGVPFVIAVQREFDPEPAAGADCMALGYFHNMYRGMPVVKKNGVLIVTHPLYDEFDPRHHPSYIEFFHRVLPETTRLHRAAAQV